MPRIRPPTMPMRIFSFHFGALGILGAIAGCTIDSLTDECEPDAYNVFSTTELSDFAAAFAIFAAWAGSPSVTEILTKAVFVGLVTLICPLSCATDVCRPRSSMTGCSTDCVVVSVGYDLIWLMIYELPLLCSAELVVSLPSLYVAKSCAVDEYATGLVAVQSVITPTTATNVTTIVIQCFLRIPNKSEKVTLDCFAVDAVAVDCFSLYSSAI